MPNFIKSFTLFVRPDEKSQQIANTLRELNSKSSSPLIENSDGDLIIAIGGDGTFIDAVTNTNFSKSKIYTGIHTGTLGFLQDLSSSDIYSLIQYINFEKNLHTRKIYVASIIINLKNNQTRHFFALNEILIAGESYSKISFSQYINGELLQNVSASGIIVASSTGDTAFSLNTHGAIDFSRNFQLVCTLVAPIQNAACERFISNPIICSKITVVPKASDNIEIIIDGKKRCINSNEIESIEISMIDDINHIHKLEIVQFSKIRVVRNKILGYEE